MILKDGYIIKCWESSDKFKANHSDSRLCEVSEVLEYQEKLFLDRLFNRCDQDFTWAPKKPEEVDYDTSWLFDLS